MNKQKTANAQIDKKPIFKNDLITLILALIVLCAVIGVLTPKFFTSTK